jgi:hypothetical protein
LTRQRKNDPWGEAVNVGPSINTTSANENGLRLSLDEKTLYFSSNRPGGFGSSDLYVVSLTLAPFISATDRASFSRRRDRAVLDNLRVRSLTASICT